jgi:hypothetical protein
MRGGRILALKDIHDFHVVIAALRYRCDYVCTYNHRDLPDGLRIGSRLEIAKLSGCIDSCLVRRGDTARL